jgi:hypothetical protein
MADMIEPIHGISKRDEVVDHVHVTAAVFAKAMDDQQYGFAVPFRNPGLIIHLGVPYTPKIAFYMIHRFSFFRLS